MDKQASELLEKIRQQFDSGPFPRIPLEESPQGNASILYIYNLVTPYYLKKQKVIKTQNKVILDAGCGTGYKSLVLAQANPGAKIVGIDLSEESVKLARLRLEHHNIQNVEFHALSIEELPKLGLEFDYINCDEVLYLLPEPVVGLQAMKSVLKPDGIIRANLHSSLQRVYYYRAQEVYKLMGLMDENPHEFEMEIVRQTYKALQDRVILKETTWAAELEKDEEWFRSNYLLQCDKGYTIPEMFSTLRAAELEFISMVQWRQWELMDLFKDPDNLPVFLAMSLPELSIEERLHLFELLHPIHRLLDFWCAHPQQADSCLPIPQWQLSDWQGAMVHLHPQLSTPQSQEDLMECIANHRPFEISRYIPAPTMASITVESSMAACLLPLWEGAQSFTSLVERWLKIRPLHPATLQPVSEKTAFDQVKELLSSLEAFVYVLLER